MLIRQVGAKINSNDLTGSILYLLANWNKSSNCGAARAFASIQASSLPWIHNHIHPRHRLPVAPIIRQFSLAPSLLSQHTAVAQSGKDQLQPQEKRKGGPPRWTLEEDIIIYNCIRENKQIVDFYHRFPGRSMGAVSGRAYTLRNAWFVPPEKGGLVESADMTAAECVKALRQIILNTHTTLDQSKEDGSYTARTTSAYMEYTTKGPRHPFSKEEKKMLTKLVRKYRNSPKIWSMVSGGSLVDEEGAPRLNRSATSCRNAWKAMNRSASIMTGKWDGDERRRLVEAIKSQVGDEYEICLGVKEEGPEGSSQLATTSGLDSKPALTMGSHVLRNLNWEKIASE
ncbi:hypothetical protein BGX21_008352, partial [Mortierella sp. AD011]